MIYIVGFLSLITFIIFYYSGNSIAKKLDLYDDKKIPVLGGIYLLIGYILNYILNENSSENNLFFIEPLFLLPIFLIALLDDKFDLNPYFRLIIIVIISSVFISSENFYIQTLNFKYFGFFNIPDNKFINILLPIFCILVFINAFNFTDGINGLASLLGLSWFIYLGLKFNFLIESYHIFFIFLLFFLVLNFTNKLYLGDSGNYIISIIIGFLLIVLNKKFVFSLYIEEILLMLLIPGLDLIRLFFIRIKKKRNPLKGDKNHLHHHLVKKVGLVKSLIIYLLLVNIPIYVFLINEDLLIFLLVFSSLTYFFIINKLNRK